MNKMFMTLIYLKNSTFLSLKIPYYMKFSRQVNFANFAIQKKSRNLSDAKIKYREINMTRKLGDSHYVNN